MTQDAISLDGRKPIKLSIANGDGAFSVTLSEMGIERAPEPTPSVPWTRDITDELATNYNCSGLLRYGWWKRDLRQINGVTFHHTLSGSPHATAGYYIHKGGGRPSIPYTIWVTETGEVLKCLALTEGCWHDHTGHNNTHLSVGLAGSLHVHEPSEAQLDAAAQVAAWAVRNEEMDVTRESVKGHMNYAATVCPGWASKASGHWKSRLMNRIDEKL